MLLEVITGLVVLIILAYAAENVLSHADDPLEPRRLPPKVPLIGHIIGLIQSGPSYHSTLRYEANTENLTETI